MYILLKHYLKKMNLQKKYTTVTLFIILISLVLLSSTTLTPNQKVNSYHNLNYTQYFDEIERLYIDTISIYPKDDNNCDTLLKRYRTWWMSKIENIDTNVNTVIKIRGDGWRGGTYVVPVYSYNNIDWFRFSDSSVFDEYGSMAMWNYTITKKFEKPTIYVARTYPYPAERIENIISQYSSHPYFFKEIIGYSPKGFPIYCFTITNRKVSSRFKKDVWIHSRTHPAETGSSFVLEGMIDYLLGQDNMASNKVNLNKLIFHIIPIVNIDGVVCANSRRSPLGYDIEREWRKIDSNKYYLQDSVAVETKIIHKKITSLIVTGAKFFLSLNLHSKNAQQNEHPFMYSNFTRSLKAHGTNGDRLFYKQLHFCKLVSDNFCGDTFMIRRSYKPMQDMAEKVFVESWWWANFKDEIMAGTLEFPESKTYCSYNDSVPKRATPKDYFDLGEALAKSIYQYYLIYETPNPFLKYKEDGLSKKFLLNYYRKP